MKAFYPDSMNMFRRFIIIPLLFASILYGCTGLYTNSVKNRGIYHRVKSGETLWSIARAYNVNPQELAEINNITDKNMLGADSVLFVPEADEVIDDVMSTIGKTESPGKTMQKEKKLLAPVNGKEAIASHKAPSREEVLASRDFSKGKEAISSREESKSLTTKSKGGANVVTATVSPKHEAGHKVEKKSKAKDNGAESERIAFDKERFIWPVKGKVRSKFGSQPNNMYYNGIEIAAKEGTPILAAASGTVIFSNSPKCCGETIIIKHDDNYMTVYYNLGNRIVKVNDQVKKGSHIAFLGKPEKKGESYLNFEIRYKNKARNPLFFLP